MEKPQTVDERYEENNCEKILDLFQTICDVQGHLFDIEPERDIFPKQAKDDLFKWCFVCESLIKFWKYSPDMVDAIESKELCC
jgi:hypothetical protein